MRFQSLYRESRRTTTSALCPEEFPVLEKSQLFFILNISHWRLLPSSSERTPTSDQINSNLSVHCCYRNHKNIRFKAVIQRFDFETTVWVAVIKKESETSDQSESREEWTLITTDSKTPTSVFFKIWPPDCYGYEFTKPKHILFD